MKKKLSRRGIDRLENILIVLLVCSALLLIRGSGMFQSVTSQGAGTGGELLLTGVQDTALSRAQPSRLVIQNSQGRYGVEYDQEEADHLYHQGLSQLLLQAVDALEGIKTVNEADWQSALTQTDSWVYYDFLYDVSFTSQSGQGEGAGRIFLLTGRSGRVDTVYYYNDANQAYYVGTLRETQLTFPQTMEELVPNQVLFAFEDDALSQQLAPNMLLLSQPALCPVYQVDNPLAELDEAGQQALVESLGINLRTAAIYEAADGTVIQEGSDTLRIQKNGKITFHAAENGQARYQALSAREKDLQIKAEELLDAAVQDRLGEGRLCCQKIETLPDGTVELTFCYLLNGTPVQLWEEGWSAQFLFEGSDLVSFSIYLRQYTLTNASQQALPVRQAAAAAAAIGQTGKELQLCYLDDGSAQEVTADWTVRDGT